MGQAACACDGDQPACACESGAAAPHRPAAWGPCDSEDVAEIAMPPRVEGEIDRLPRPAALSPDWTSWDRVNSQQAVPESALGRAPPRKARLREAAAASILSVSFLLQSGEVCEVRFHHRSIGMHFGRSAGVGPSLVVSGLVLGGQGLTLGVQKGWLVHSVNGEDVRRLAPEQVLRALQKGGAQLEDVAPEETRAGRSNSLKKKTNYQPPAGVLSKTGSERIQKPPPLSLLQPQAGPLPSLVSLPISQYVSAASMKEVLASLPEKPDAGRIGEG